MKWVTFYSCLLFILSPFIAYGDYTVSGFGNANANGCYTRTGTYNGYNYYSNSATWVMEYSGTPQYNYIGSTLGAASYDTNPGSGGVSGSYDQGSFQVNSGTSPAGTVVWTTCGTTNTNSTTTIDTCVATGTYTNADSASQLFINFMFEFWIGAFALLFGLWLIKRLIFD